MQLSEDACRLRSIVALLCVPAILQAQGSATAIRTEEENARWREDLRFFASELPKLHVEAHKYVTPAAFARAVAEVDSAIPVLTDRQIRWRFMRLTALVRDGHTNAQIPMYAQRLPVTMFWADDGPYITGAAPEYASLLGQRVVRLNGHAIRAVADTIRLYLPHENEMGFRARAGFILFYPGAQRDVGLSNDSSKAVLELRGRGGKRSTVELPVVARAGFTPALPPNGEPLYRQRMTEKYWVSDIPDARTVFLKYNQCRDAAEFRVLSDSIMRMIDSGATRLVVDLRHNSGGSSQVIKPLIAAIRARPTLNQPGSLYAIVGRATFSSGMAAAFDLRSQTKATIVGEPIGERPNTFGELRRFTLPNSKIEVPSLGMLAAQAGVHPVHLARAFRAHFGLTIRDFVRQRRLEYVCRELVASKRSVAEIALDAGFADQSHLTKAFQRNLGTTPARYRSAAHLS